MIKSLIYIFLINIYMSHFVIGDSESFVILKNRLNKINNLYVHFIQKYSTSNGEILEKCQGEFWMKRPNLFYWHMIFPEESFLIFDGQILWFYIPVINQVTIYSAESITNSIFWMLFFNDNKLMQCSYNIFQKEDNFFLKPVYNNIDMREYDIKITDCGMLQQFSVIEYYGDRISCYLSQHDSSDIDISKFSFKLSKDIQIDDQRDQLYE